MPLKPNRQIGKRSRKEDVLDAKKNRTWITPKGKKYEFDYEKQGSRYIFILIYKDNRMRVPESDWNRTDIDDLINSMEKGMAIENKKSNRLRQIIKEEIQKSLNETSIRPEVLDMFEGSCNERNLAAFKKLLESLCKEWAGPSGGYFDEDDIVEYISYLVSQHRDIWD